MARISVPSSTKKTKITKKNDVKVGATLAKLSGSAYDGFTDLGSAIVPFTGMHFAQQYKLTMIAEVAVTPCWSRRETPCFRGLQPDTL